MTTRKQLTAEQLTQFDQFIADYNGGNYGEYLEELEDSMIITSEPIDNFRKIATTGVFDEDANCWELEGVQRKKGDSRSTMYIFIADGFLAIYEI